METQNAQTTLQGSSISNFKQSFSNYQKNQKGKTRKTKEEILAKYFTPRNTRETFRILPYKTKHFFVEAFFHVADAMVAGGKKKLGGLKIYCPAHNDPKIKKLDEKGQVMLDGNNNPIMIPASCPLCAKHRKLISKQDPSIKFIKKVEMNEYQLKINENNKKIFLEANKWEAKKFYIIKGVDKGKPADGIKFWRFKHNFQNQGTLDKLFPVLDNFVSMNGVGFEDPKQGTDLYITMADSKTNSGVVYKAISAIMARGKSPLHEDELVVRQWLEDDITWRDVYLPKKAPNITSEEFLEMVANGVNPYWDDIDSNNKHWVFPGRPDLEAKANTRKLNLDNDEDAEFEQASDLVDDEDYITINNITAKDVGTYTENAVNLTANINDNNEQTVVVDNDVSDSDNDNYSDLPF